MAWATKAGTPTTMPISLNVLILGGGDGMAAREVLKWADVGVVETLKLHLVDLDSGMTDLFATLGNLRTLNGDALNDPQV